MKNPTPYLIDKENLKSKKFPDLPHNIDAEQQLLGAIIRNNNLVPKSFYTYLRLQTHIIMKAPYLENGSKTTLPF